MKRSPAGASPIVSLTFDDALDVHLDNAAPLLERHGLRGTFYAPVSSSSLLRRSAEWSALAARGHEIGNHTVFHPGVARKPSVRPGSALEEYSLSRMALELEAANDVLHMIDGKSCRSFAYPGSYSIVGRPGVARRALERLRLDRTRLRGWLDRHEWLDVGSRRKDYHALMAPLFVAARGGEAPPDREPAFPPDRYRVPALTGDRLGAAELIGLVESRRESQPWIVLVFHGVGGGHRLSCDLPHFEALLEHLAASTNVRVMTFADAASAIWGGPQ